VVLFTVKRWLALALYLLSTILFLASWSLFQDVLPATAATTQRGLYYASFRNAAPVVAQNADGRLEVFLVGQNTQLYHNWQTSPGNWSGWFSLGGSWP
jgi:hypothetical protein